LRQTAAATERLVRSSAVKNRMEQRPHGKNRIAWSYHLLMRANVLHHQAPIDERPLSFQSVPDPEPNPGEVLVRVEACGVCRTDLHVVEGDLPPVTMPIIPGHQVVGRVAAAGAGASRFGIGARVGIAWLRHTDGTCRYCLSGHENLCPNARFTGYMADGGYAELAVVPEDFAYVIPEGVEPLHAAPLLCAGIIGYRALRRSEIRPGGRLGLYGFGASAHVVLQIARHWGCSIFVATRGDRHQAMAREMGADWVGGATERPPEPLDAAIVFAPAGEIVSPALEALDRGGTLALAGIYMTEIPPLDYERHLFFEKSVRSVTANARQDGEGLLALAAEIPIRTQTEVFPLDGANDALWKLKHDQIRGSAVLLPYRHL
jgi:propanol-preferring alcohol dehydrogenase